MCFIAIIQLILNHKFQNIVVVVIVSSENV